MFEDFVDFYKERAKFERPQRRTLNPFGAFILSPSGKPIS
jgi:hypothetical protein